MPLDQLYESQAQQPSGYEIDAATIEAQGRRPEAHSSHDQQNEVDHGPSMPSGPGGVGWTMTVSVVPLTVTSAPAASVGDAVGVDA